MVEIKERHEHPHTLDTVFEFPRGFTSHHDDRDGRHNASPRRAKIAHTPGAACKRGVEDRFPP